MLRKAVEDGLQNCSVRFLESGQEFSAEQLRELGTGALESLDDLGSDGAVGVILSNDALSVAVLLGALSSNRTLVSLPPPGRSDMNEEYLISLRKSCEQLDVRSVVVNPATAAVLRRDDSIPPVLVDHHELTNSLGRRRSPLAEGKGFRLVQFTSGSTRAPRGVVLADSDVLANVEATLAVLEPTKGDGVCSWLPLSHDMGLLGMLLCPIVAASPSWAGLTSVTMMEPKTFLRSPKNWLRAISEGGATITASPDLGLRLSARRASGTDLDLSRLRAVIVGGEIVRPQTLRDFSDAFSFSGLSGRSICPAYGFAEAGLAVTLSSPRIPWDTAFLDTTPDDDAGAPAGVDPGARGHHHLEVTKCGPPLPGYEVVAGSDGQRQGVLRVRGPSVARKYANGEPVSDQEGWLRTNDLGTVVDGDLAVIGRCDDIMVVGGRNIVATEVEASLDTVRGVRPNGAVIAQLSDGRWAVVVEIRSTTTPSTAKAALSEVRRRVVGHCGAAPDLVLAVGPGGLPTTTSGKRQRSALARALREESLEVLHTL